MRKAQPDFFYCPQLGWRKNINYGNGFFSINFYKTIFIITFKCYLK